MFIQSWQTKGMLGPSQCCWKSSELLCRGHALRAAAEMRRALALDPVPDKIRNAPEFQGLVRRLGMPVIKSES
jgi:hypothetical protein